MIPDLLIRHFTAFHFNLFQFKTYFKLSVAIKNEFDLMSYKYNILVCFVVFLLYIMYHYKTLGVIKRVSAVYNKTKLFSF